MKQSNQFRDLDLSEYLSHVIKNKKRPQRDIYKDMCVFYKVPLNTQLYHALKIKQFQFNLDNLTKKELNIFSYVLEFFKFESVELYSNLVPQPKPLQKYEITEMIKKQKSSQLSVLQTSEDLLREQQLKKTQKEKIVFRTISSYAKEQKKLEDEKIEMVRHEQPFKSLFFQKQKFTNVITGEHTKFFDPLQDQIFVEKNEEIYSQDECLTNILKALNKNLRQNDMLHSLRLYGLRFDREGLQELSKGLLQTKYVKNLFINNCELQTKDVATLYEGLSHNTSIIILDLSHNLLDKNIGMYIGQILGAHSQRRNDIIWLYSLRYELNSIYFKRDEEPEEDLQFKGICEVNISYNKLDDTAVKDLASFLDMDTWLRCIGLRQNKIGEDGVKTILDMLDSNDSIISLDLRQNKGFNSSYSKTLIQKLMVNITTLQQTIIKPIKQVEKSSSDLTQSKVSESEKPLQTTQSLSTLKSDKQLNQKNNFTSIPTTVKKPVKKTSSKSYCGNCVDMQQKLINIQKQNLSYQTEIKQLRMTVDELNQQQQIILQYLSQQQQQSEQEDYQNSDN